MTKALALWVCAPLHSGVRLPLGAMAQGARKQGRDRQQFRSRHDTSRQDHRRLRFPCFPCPRVRGHTPRLSPEHEAPLSRGAQPLGSRPNETPSLSLEKLELSGSRPSMKPLSRERGASFRARALSSRSPPRSTRESSLPRPYRPFLRRTRVAAGAPIPHARARTRAIANRSTGDLHIDGKTNLPVV